MQFSSPYRAVPHPPYWGYTNAQSNYCEEDHIITTYIAEFINTLTNAVYLFYAYKGLKSNSNRPDAALRNFPYLGIAGVGIGSAVFHATMKNYTQWCKFLHDLPGIFILDMQCWCGSYKRGF
jgi:dihydroceramidase